VFLSFIWGIKLVINALLELGMARGELPSMGAWPRIHCFGGYSKRSLQETQERGIKGTASIS
jgi:hypothetical protein